MELAARAGKLATGVLAAQLAEGAHFGSHAARGEHGGRALEAMAHAGAGVVGEEEIYDAPPPARAEDEVPAEEEVAPSDEQRLHDEDDAHWQSEEEREARS